MQTRIAPTESDTERTELIPHTIHHSHRHQTSEEARENERQSTFSPFSPYLQIRRSSWVCPPRVLGGQGGCGANESFGLHESYRTESDLNRFSP